MKNIFAAAFLFTISFMTSPTASAGWDPADSNKNDATSIEMEQKVYDAVADFKSKDSDLYRFFDNAYGFAVFPSVGKGAIGVGGAYGKGLVYEQNEAIGTTTLKQVSYGFQLGGQKYSQIIFFKDQPALNNFIAGNFEFGAGISAVALTTGASADTDYSKGVAVFTMAKGGLMYEASISGQKFSFTPFE